MGYNLFADAFDGKIYKFYDVKRAVLDAQKQIKGEPVYVAIKHFGLTFEIVRPDRGLSFYKVFSDKVLKYVWNPRMKDYKIESF